MNGPWPVPLGKNGIFTALYRDSFTDPTLLEPGTIYEYEIDLAVTGNVFRRGHAIRLEIFSSKFPRFDRNPNTGRRLGLDTEMQPAHQTVNHSATYPSHILLPVV